MKIINDLRVSQNIMRAFLIITLSFLFVLSGYSQRNIAPFANVTVNTSKGDGCFHGDCNRLNDLDFGICGNPQMWLNTSKPPSRIIGEDYIEWTFPSRHVFDTLVFHHGSITTQILTGATVQYWDGIKWVTHSVFSSFQNQCVTRIGI